METSPEASLPEGGGPRSGSEGVRHPKTIDLGVTSHYVWRSRRGDALIARLLRNCFGKMIHCRGASMNETMNYDKAAEIIKTASKFYEEWIALDPMRDEASNLADASAKSVYRPPVF